MNNTNAVSAEGERELFVNIPICLLKPKENLNQKHHL